MEKMIENSNGAVYATTRTHTISKSNAYRAKYIYKVIRRYIQVETRATHHMIDHRSRSSYIILVLYRSSVYSIYVYILYNI